MAELAGANESDIRRLGRWNNQALAGCYLSALPRSGMRTMAGFPPVAGSFFLRRAILEPPEALKKMVFPFVDSWLNNERPMEKTLAVQGT